MKRLILILAFLILAAASASAMQALGVVADDTTITFWWNTFDDDGASVTRATNGTVKVIRNDGTDSTGTAVTDTEDSPDVGIHKCAINLADNVNLATGYAYTVWVDGAVIDGDTVNAALARFTIGAAPVNVVQWLGTAAVALPTNFEDLNITDTTGLVRPDMANASGNYAGTVATVTTLTNWDKTGYALSATGADLILKTATFSVAMADAVWEKAARTITGGTITTYTGNTPQTGDSFALIGATGSGLTSLAPAATALSSATWTGTKAGYLDIAVSSRGTGTALDAAGLRTAIGLATANLDTQLADLPTVAEMNARTLAAASYATATALATAQADLDNPNQYKATGFSTHSAADVVTALGTGTTLTAVPWNAAWDAEVQSECADALGVFWTSPATLVNLVWNELLAGHATAGSAGKTLSDGATIIIGP